MSTAAPPKSSCSTTHFHYEKGFFYKIRCGVLEQRACIYSGAPNDCFLWNICSQKQNCLEFSIAWGRLKISRWPFHSCTIFEAYLIKSPPLSQDGDFIYFFLSGFVFSFLFSRLNSQRAKKMYSSKGIISLWSALSFFFLFGDINLIYFSCDGITAPEDYSFGRNWICPYCASRFRKTAAGRIIFSSN